jgi:hypothetical protein
VTIAPAAQAFTCSIPAASVSGASLFAPSVFSIQFSLPAAAATAIRNVTIAASVQTAQFTLNAPIFADWSLVQRATDGLTTKTGTQLIVRSHENQIVRKFPSRDD